MDNASALRKNLVWNTFGSVAYMVCQWLFTILVVRLSPAGLGENNAGNLYTALTVTGIFLSVASYGMYNYQVSDEQNKYAQSIYVRSRVYTCTLAVTLCAGFVVLTGIFGTPYSTAECLCIFLFLGYRLVESVTDVYNAIEQKHGRLDLAGKTYLARGILSLALFCGGLVLTRSLTLTLALLVLGNVCFFILFTLRMAKPFYKNDTVAHRTVFALLAECLPLAVYVSLSTVAATIPKLFLGQMLGNVSMGIYGPVTAPVLLLQTGATYLFIPFITVFSGCYARKDARAFRNAFVLVQGIVLLLIPLGLLVARYLGPWGLATFVSPDYAAYAYLLPPMVLSAVLTATVLFWSMLLTIMRRMRTLMLANVCGIAVALAVSAPCLRKWDLQGATYAAILALCAQLAYLLVAMLLHTRQHFNTPPAREESEVLHDV